MICDHANLKTSHFGTRSLTMENVNILIYCQILGMYLQCRMSFLTSMRESLATTYSVIFDYFLSRYLMLYLQISSFIHLHFKYVWKNKSYILHDSIPPKNYRSKKSLIYELDHSLWKWHHSNLLICRIYGLGTSTRIFDQVFLMEVFDTFFK